MRGTEQLEALVDDAMKVCCFDWDWDNEEVPEVRAARTRLRELFRATLKQHARPDTARMDFLQEKLRADMEKHGVVWPIRCIALNLEKTNGDFRAGLDLAMAAEPPLK